MESWNSDISDTDYKDVVKQVLKQKKQLSPDRKGVLENSIRKFVKVRGYRNPLKAATTQLTQAIVAESSVGNPLPGIFEAWLELHDNLFGKVSQFMDSYTSSETELSAGQKENASAIWSSEKNFNEAVEEFQKQHSDFESKNTELMFRLLKNSEQESVQDKSTDKKEHLIVLNRILDELQDIPADSPEWEPGLISQFITDVEQLGRKKHEEHQKILCVNLQSALKELIGEEKTLKYIDSSFDFSHWATGTCSSLELDSVENHVLQLSRMLVEFQESLDQETTLDNWTARENRHKKLQEAAESIRNMYDCLNKSFSGAPKTIETHISQTQDADSNTETEKNVRENNTHNFVHNQSLEFSVGPEHKKNPEYLNSIQERRREPVETVSQIVLMLSKGSNDSAFENALEIILKWVENRAGTGLPEKAWEGESFSLDDNPEAQSVEAIAINYNGRYWASRIIDADKTVARREWPTEISIAEKDESVVFGIRLQCVTRGNHEPFSPTIPGVVRNIVETGFAYVDGRKISTEPWFIKSQEDVEKLLALLTSSNRILDVIVFSLSKDLTGEDKNETVVLASDVLKRTLGAAHVAVITDQASFWLSDCVGKEFSVFQRAVRTYRPGFDPDTDEPFTHPLATEKKILEWSNEGPRAYKKFLISSALKQSISNRDEQDIPSFARIRRNYNELILSKQRNNNVPDTDLLNKLEEINKQLKGDLEEQIQTSDELLGIVENEKSEAIREKEGLKDANWHLRSRIEKLEEKLREYSYQPIDFEIPESLENFEDWCHENLAGSVKVLRRAFNTVKKSQYEDISLIYKSLLLLRDFYVPMKRYGGKDRNEKYAEECKKLGLNKDTPSITKARAGEENKQYYVDYDSKKKQLLNRHLKKGNKRDSRQCFRLYFLWDDEQRCVKVGSLPFHLDTRAT